MTSSGGGLQHPQERLTMLDITVGAIRSLLERQAHRDRNAPAARAALSNLDPSTRLVLSEGSTAEMRWIYQRRADRPSQAVRLADLVSNLEQHADDTVLSTYAQAGGGLVYLFLSSTELDLIGCLVGREDRPAESLD